MIIALSVCVGVSIMVSWCKRHRLVGKWWFCMAAWLWLGTVSQQFPECSVVLVSGSGRLDSHHTLMYVFLAFEEHQYLTERETFFFFTKGEHISLTFALVLKCLILELCTQVLPRSWEETRATDFKTSYMRSSLWLSHVASMVATVYAQSGGHSGKPFHRFCVSVRHSEPYII